MLEALITVTSFHHQPEAQHPNSSAIHKNAGRLPHLWVDSVEKVRFPSTEKIVLLKRKPLRCT